MRRGRKLDDEVSAALALVQARQQSLLHGSVLPRAVSPPTAKHGTSSSPIAKEKTQQHMSNFQWLKRRVVRQSEKALEDLTSLEFVPSASLATVRSLIDQFIALPPRRKFAFLYPTTNTPVDEEKEKDILAATFPFLCIVLKEGSRLKDDVRLRPVTAKLQPQKSDNLRPQTVDFNAKRAANSTAASIPSTLKGDKASYGNEREKNEDLNSKMKLEFLPKVEKSARKLEELLLETRERKQAIIAPIGSKRNSGEFQLQLHDTPTRELNQRVKSDLKLATMAKEEEKQVSIQLKCTNSFKETETNTLSELAVKLPHFGTEMKEETITQSKNVVYEEAFEKNEDKVSLQSSVETNSDTSKATSDVSTSPEKILSPNFRSLRRSRQFRSASVAILAEKDWGTDLVQEEVATDEQVEKLIDIIVEVFYKHLPGIDPCQLDAACKHYGIDYHALELQGILLALDNELSIRCNHIRNGVDGQLTQYLLKQLPVAIENIQNPETLRHFENSLNLFAGMRGWQAPTKLRVSCFEDKQHLQLIPPSDSKRLSLLRLSDKDHKLFTMASLGNSTALEKWLGDGLEITYVLLYGFLHSRQNSGPKALAKLDAISVRQDRIQAAIEKFSSFSLEVWKRLEFRTTDIEDVSMLRRLNELLRRFLHDSKLHCGEIEGSVFFPVFISYLTRKSDQLAQSLSKLNLSPHGAHDSQYNSVVECINLLRQQLELQTIHSTTADAHLLNNGLNIIDVEKINASRSISGLGRIYLNERGSVLTHHQCKMMASDKYLHLKARWDVGELSWGETSRFFFVEAKEVSLEFVFIRRNPDQTFDDDMCWEDGELFARKEAKYAFSLLCGKSLHVPLDVAIGVGMNIVHTDLLPHINSVRSLSVVLQEYPETTSISVGYCYAPTTQVTRVVFRVHTETFKGQQNDKDCDIMERWKLPSVIKRAGDFLYSANEDEAIAFCDAGGLSFLDSRLQEEGNSWRSILFGLPFLERIYQDDNARCPTEDILRAMKITISVIPRELNSITKQNLQILFNLVETLPDSSKVVDEVINTIQLICFKVHEPASTGIQAEFSTPPMTEIQRKFVTQDGLKFLVTAVESLQLSPAHKISIEIAIVNLLQAHEFSLKSGLLVHWHEWLEFYVKRSESASPTLSVYLLSQIYMHFFTSHAFVEPGVERCMCGCQTQSLDVIDGCVGIMEMFVRLMLTENGVIWAQEEMKGPEACISFLCWSVNSQQKVPKTMTELQNVILQSLLEFLERMTSSHQYLRILLSLTPRLLCLLKQQDCPSLHPATLRVLSLTFRLAVDKKVWSISMELFLAAFYQVLESLCDDPSLSIINDVMIAVILKSAYLENIICLSVNHNNMLDLLHEEHVNFVGGSGQLSPVARSRTKSLLQTLVSMCSLTWNSVLQPFCQIPAILSLGWMLTSFKIAEDLAQLELDELLLTLMENDNNIVSILAIRTFTVFSFHNLASPRVVDEYRLKRLCNLLTTSLGSGNRLMHSPKRVGNTENPETIQFAANEHDLYAILLRYSVCNKERQSKLHQQELEQEDLLHVEESPTQSIWEGSEWNDSSRAGAEKLAANLKLLAVFTSVTRNVVLIGNSDEIRQIIVLLVQFIRDRAHRASQHLTLYLLSLRNIVWATRKDVAKWGYTDFSDASFLQKLLQFSIDRAHQDSASGILWGLADAYEETNTFLLSFIVDNALAKSGSLSKKTGFTVMIENLASKITSGRSAENDSGALASMIVNPTAGDFFIANYGYSFVLKLIGSTMRSTVARQVVTLLQAQEESFPVNEVFGTMLFYENPINHQKDRELLQLCRIASKTLKIMQTSNPESLVDETARTRATLLPLLNHSNNQIALHAIWCCSSHLQAHPTKCGKLFESDVQDKIIAYFFDKECPTIQAAAFSCMKLALADQSVLLVLQTKLFPLREMIVSCLRTPHFQVKRKAIVFLVEAIFRLDDQRFLDGVAEAFAAPDNQEVLLDLFNSLSNDLKVDPAAGGVLQLLTHLILKLDLVAHTDGDQLVHGICLTLRAHSTDTFVRPTLLNCLHQIVIQDERVFYLSRKSRLDAITDLLSQQLTLSELRDIVSMLLFVASKHSGIRHYFSGFLSGCIPKIASVFDTFSEYSLDHDTSENSVHLTNSAVFTLDDEKKKEKPDITSEFPTSFLLKVTTIKVVYISHFTEDIYEQFLRLLLLLLKSPEFNSEERYGCLCEEKGCINCEPSDIVAKARCGHLILRLVAAHRIPCATFNLPYLLSTVGTPTTTILSLSIEVLESLAANYQCRDQMLRGVSKFEWSWLTYLVNPVMHSEFYNPSDGESNALGASQTDVVIPILLLGHLSTAKEVAQRLIADYKFMSRLFSFIAPGDSLFAPDVAIRRASSFTLARLTEHSSVVQDTFVQEKMAKLALHPSDLNDTHREQDKIVLANKMVLGRNWTLLTPGLQGRSADEGMLSALVSLLPTTLEDFSHDFDIGLISADVLSHLLYFRANVRDEMRLRSVLWRYARTMSPTKPVKDQNYPSSKRLTAFLHNWIGPTLRKLRNSVSGASKGDSMQLLHDDLVYTYHQLQTPSTSELLYVLVSLQLQYDSPEVNLNTGYELLDDANLDVIEPFKYTENVKHSRPRYLQYSFTDSDRSTREPNDFSFYGSAHMWLFLRKLWELCEGSSQPLQDIVRLLETNIPRILTRWEYERDTKFSASAYDRRQCFLEFLVAVGETESGLLSVVDVKTVVNIVVGYGLESGANVGTEYKLLGLVCQQFPEQIETLVQYFNLDGDSGHEHKPLNSFCTFWGRVRLRQFFVKLSWPSDITKKIAILDPTPDADLATIFGIDLLQRISTRVPQITQLYAQCQGYTALLDMMLQTSKVSALQMTHILIRTFMSNLLYLVNQLVQHDPTKYNRVLFYDPRYLRCIVDLVYAPAHQVQTAAIKLLHNLAHHSQLCAILSRIENLIPPLGAENAEFAVYVGEILKNRQISPSFTQDRLVVLLHVWFIPFFTDLSTTELVKLSLGFNLYIQSTENAGVLIIHDNRFSAIPEWMLELKNSTNTSFTNVMKRLQERFEGAMHQTSHNMSMYSITKEEYVNATTLATRRRIATRLSNLLKTSCDDTNMYRGSLRSRNVLVSRLGRLLIEDRAEIIRRVAFTKRISERKLFKQMQRRQLSDLLSILQVNPLFEGIQRDLLANLAFRLGDPVELLIDKVAGKSKLPLLILFDEGVEFEMIIQRSQSTIRGTASRGNLLGFPMWLESNPESEDNFTVVHKCGVLGIILSREILESELTETALSLVDERLRSAYSRGDTQKIAQLMGLKEDFAVHLPARRRLQSSASSLLVQLVTTDDFIDSLLNDSWTIGIVMDVAQAALPADVVLNAMTVFTAAMTVNEVYAKKFWAKASVIWKEHLSENTKPHTLTPVQLIAELVNRFKLRLWLSHPEILKAFFLIQSQVSRYIPTFWSSLKTIWTKKYLCSCLDLLRSGHNEVIDVVGRHLSESIPHRMDYLTNCGQTMNLHLELAEILVQTRCRSIIGLLRLFNAFCSEEILHEEIWERIVTESDSLESVLFIVVEGISQTCDSGSSDELEVYCNFIYLASTSGVNELLDVEYRSAMENRFGILSALLTKMHKFPEGYMNYLILRSIGSMCIESPPNCILAATTVIRSEVEECHSLLVDYVVKRIVELQELLQANEFPDALLVEATFSCIPVIALEFNQMECFTTNDLVVMTLQVIHLITKTAKRFSPTALRALMRSMFHTLKVNAVMLADVLDETNTAILIAGYNQISTYFSAAVSDLPLLRLLQEYTNFLSSLLSSQKSCDTLWMMCCSNSDVCNNFVTWICYWIVFEASKAPDLDNLIPDRSRKRLKLLNVFSTMQDTVVTLVTALSAHESFSELLSFHPDFEKIVKYIFDAFHESSSLNVDRATAWIKFICFIAEQWDQHQENQESVAYHNRMTSVQKSLRYCEMQILLKICYSIQAQSDTFVCYALRFMWLFVKLNLSLIETENKTIEFHEVLPLASIILKTSSSSECTRCNMIGLMAELSVRNAFLALTPQFMSDLVDVVRSAMMLLVKDSMRISREIFVSISSELSDDFLSSRKWHFTQDQEMKSHLDNQLQFGIIHQTFRFVLYLYKIPQTRKILSDAPFFHPLLRQTFFANAIEFLRITRRTEMFMKIQEDGLQLITILYNCTTSDRNTKEFRAYCLTARREKYLSHCIRLLSEPQTRNFQLTILESLASYVNCNIRASSEVVTLREQENVDLLGVLLSILSADDITESRELSDVSLLCLRVFNSLIEFSYSNAVYAAIPTSFKVLEELLEVAARHDALLSSDLPRTTLYIARMLKNSDSNIDAVIWKLVTTVLVHPQISLHLKTLQDVLETLRISANSGIKVLQFIVQEWDVQGRLVVRHLIDLALGNEVSTNNVTDNSSISHLAMKTLAEMCNSDTFCDCISSDQDIIFEIVTKSPWTENQTQLLKFLAQRSQFKHNKSLLSLQIESNFDKISLLKRDQQLFLLELLPCLPPFPFDCEHTLHVLHCVLEEIKSCEDKAELLIFLRALWSVLRHYDLILLSWEIVLEFNVVLTQLVTDVLPCDSKPLILYNDEYFFEQSSNISMLSPLELLLLVSLCKFSTFLQTDFLLLDQLGLSCVFMWMNLNSGQLDNSEDQECFHLLTLLVFYYLHSDNQTKASNSILGSRPYWRVLTRRFTCICDESINFSISKLMLQLLRGPSTREFLGYVSETLKLDLVDILWWKVCSTSQTTETERSERCVLWCSILDELCFNRDDVLTIMEKGFLEHFTLHGYLELNVKSAKKPVNSAFLRLFSSIFRVSYASDHERYFQQQKPLTIETLTEVCASTIEVNSGNNDEAKWSAITILYALAMSEDTLPVVRKAFNLEENHKMELEKARERICAISEMLLLYKQNVSVLIHMIKLILKVFGSSKSIAALIQARNESDYWPMVDVLVDILELSTTSMNRLGMSIFRPIQISTRDPAEFLPYEPSSDPNAEATILTLQLIYICAANQSFATSLKTETDLLHQLFICLATANWEISSRAAMTLSIITRCFEGGNDVEDIVGDISRYNCDNGFYRKLEFFSFLSSQKVIKLSPTSSFPCCFVLLTRWIRFYSVNLSLLSESQLVLPFESIDDDFSTDLQTDLHETLVENVLELLLYCVANFHDNIFKSESSDKKELEHSLLLQSLLALCQRRFNNAESFPDLVSNEEGDSCIVSSGVIRSRSLELVQLLSSFNLSQTSTIKVFANQKQMLILMMMIERSASSVEQCAAIQLMEALALHSPIKTLLVGDKLLLSRLGAWLENDMLNLDAAAIFQRLASPPDKTYNLTANSVFSFAPNVQKQLAYFLFVDRQPPAKRTESFVSTTSKTDFINKSYVVRFIIQPNTNFKHSPRWNSTCSAYPTSIQLDFQVFKQNGKQIRAFQYTGTLKNEYDSIEHELLSEQESICCRIVVSNSNERTESKHFLELSILNSSLILHHNDALIIRCESGLITNRKAISLGIIPRLLRQENDELNVELFYGLSQIVVEFCKNFDLFCDQILDIPLQIVTVLGASVRFSSTRRMDIECLENLTTWFPKKPTVSFFRKSIAPLLHLIQGFRQLSCVNNYINRSDQGDEDFLETLDNNQADFAFVPRQFFFLEKFIEMVASVDVPDHTANSLNTIFLDCSNELLYLCSQCIPEQDPNATFLSLVAIAIRKNVVHCQTFLTQTAQMLLCSVFDAGTEQCIGKPEQLHCRLLSVASLVTLRLARCPFSGHGVLNSSDRLELFSRVSFEVFASHLWVECLPSEAAEHLVLACGFFTDGLSKIVAVDADTGEGDWYSVLSTDPNSSGDKLTIVETLLLFLGRSSTDEKKTVDNTDYHKPFDSFDRLAATILASLVEKLPSKGVFEQSLLKLMDERSSVLNLKNVNNIDPRTGKFYEEQCLQGLKRCIGLTRYDFQSELNAVRLTYYSSIRAGVRTGIIPPQCSGAFQRFDQEHLLPTQKQPWHVAEIGTNGRRQLYRQRDEYPSMSSYKHLLADDLKLESELRELLLFTSEHSELLSVITVNRKKAMTTAIRTATVNARILMAFHSMASIALDFYIDTEKLLNQNKTSKYIRKNSDFSELGQMRTVFMEWLLLLEELVGLLCSGLHELDSVYYTEIARQFRTLIVDLPMFLRKMERSGTNSRHQALLLFLDNLHRLLKRATNRNELRVVSANGTGVVDQTKIIRERLRRLDAQISASLDLLLETPEGMVNLSRAIVAMVYMWRRVMGATPLDKAMATSKESVSLLKKIREKLFGVFQIVRRPKKLIRAVLLIVFHFGNKPQHAKTQQNDSSSTKTHQNVRLDLNSGKTDESQNNSAIDSMFLVTDSNNKLLSPLPFSSLELALDHFGWESLSSKRVRHLLQDSTRKNDVRDVLSVAFGISADMVDRLSVLEIAEHFHNLDVAQNSSTVLAQLEAFALEDEMPFTNLPNVVHDKMDISLWRLMVRPIQRLRLFHLYQQLQRFVLGDQTRRHRLLDGLRTVSPQKPPLSRELPSDANGVTDGLINVSQYRIPVSLPKQEDNLFSVQAVGALGSVAKVSIPQSALNICDSILNRDPFSDDAAMRLLRTKNEKSARNRSHICAWSWRRTSQRLMQYPSKKQFNVVDWVFHWLVSLTARIVVVIAFWRQEELRADLKDLTMARAFDDLRTRDEYYRLYHARKGLGEFFRVWMPSSGRLGLNLWQERRYVIGGTLLSVVIAQWLPSLVFPDSLSNYHISTTASKRNTFMTRIVYSYGIAIFILSVVSVALIARNRFVLLEQTRLRFQPISRYYQNALAVTAIVVELVQLNSLAFDPAVDWDDTDELPGYVQWLGHQGLTKFGISTASELEALSILLLLLVWFLLLKCANKFRDTSILLHRVLTKDLPALINGFCYMGTISAFFSFLACIDCSTQKYSTVEKCISAPQSPPFLIAHPSIICWTPGHQWYALLGLWGITFFLPVGLLAHGMSQVLFQRETLDIKYAPVLLLVTQLGKAVAATAQAFFPFEPIVLISLGLIGNGVLLVLTLTMHSCSLWYIKYVKCSIYAASCWAYLGAIHRLYNADQRSTRSLNMIYFGWLSIGLSTAIAILLRVWRRSQVKQRETELRFVTQQRLLNTGNSTELLGEIELKFMKKAKKRSQDAFTRAAFGSNAAKLSTSVPPPELTEFITRAKEMQSGNEREGELFMQKARVLSNQLRKHEGLRQRR